MHFSHAPCRNREAGSRSVFTAFETGPGIFRWMTLTADHKETIVLMRTISSLICMRMGDWLACIKFGEHQQSAEANARDRSIVKVGIEIQGMLAAGRLHKFTP
jgi:hypothetical protein